jgi:hypothetical protein
VSNGPSRYDVCDVCNGDGLSCLDCKGRPFGKSTYDVCDVCGGNGNTCLDCKRIPNGPNVYDRCDVCGGDGTSCLDCNGVPFGTSTYDICGICGGNGMSCITVPPERNPCAPRLNPHVQCGPVVGDNFRVRFPRDANASDFSLQEASALTCCRRVLMC